MQVVYTRQGGNRDQEAPFETRASLARPPPCRWGPHARRTGLECGLARYFQLFSIFAMRPPPGVLYTANIAGPRRINHHTKMCFAEAVGWVRGIVAVQGSNPAREWSGGRGFKSRFFFRGVICGIMVYGPNKLLYRRPLLMHVCF